MEDDSTTNTTPENTDKEGHQDGGDPTEEEDDKEGGDPTEDHQEGGDPKPPTMTKSERVGCTVGGVATAAAGAAAIYVTAPIVLPAFGALAAGSATVSAVATAGGYVAGAAGVGAGATSAIFPWVVSREDQTWSNVGQAAGVGATAGVVLSALPLAVMAVAGAGAENNSSSQAGSQSSSGNGSSSTSNKNQSKEDDDELKGSTGQNSADSKEKKKKNEAAKEPATCATGNEERKPPTKDVDGTNLNKIRNYSKDPPAAAPKSQSGDPSNPKPRGPQYHYRDESSHEQKAKKRHSHGPNPRAAPEPGTAGSSSTFFTRTKAEHTTDEPASPPSGTQHQQEETSSSRGASAGTRSTVGTSPRNGTDGYPNGKHKNIKNPSASASTPSTGGTSRNGGTNGYPNGNDKNPKNHFFNKRGPQEPNHRFPRTDNDSKKNMPTWDDTMQMVDDVENVVGEGFVKVDVNGQVHIDPQRLCEMTPEEKSILDDIRARTKPEPRDPFERRKDDPAGYGRGHFTADDEGSEVTPSFNREDDHKNESISGNIMRDIENKKRLHNPFKRPNSQFGQQHYTNDDADSEPPAGFGQQDETSWPGVMSPEEFHAYVDGMNSGQLDLIRRQIHQSMGRLWTQLQQEIREGATASKINLPPPMDPSFFEFRPRPTYSATYPR